MSEGFIVDVSTMGLFFRLCSRYKIQGREERVALLRELTKRKKAKYLRDVEGFCEGKNVLKITRRGIKNEHKN